MEQRASQSTEDQQRNTEADHERETCVSAAQLPQEDERRNEKRQRRKGVPRFHDEPGQMMSSFPVDRAVIGHADQLSDVGNGIHERKDREND